jgi:hypothetical protein
LTDELYETWREVEQRGLKEICHGNHRRLKMRKVAIYIGFVLSTAWLLFGSWHLPQTLSGTHASHEATNDYWQETPRAWMIDEAETETKVIRAEGEQLSTQE